MIWFSVGNPVNLALVGRPPLRRAVLTTGVWMICLFLGLDDFDEGFGCDLAAGLLKISTLLDKVLLHLCRVRDPQLLLVRDWDWNGCVIFRDCVVSRMI
jgi:hypothetical protein